MTNRDRIGKTLTFPGELEPVQQEAHMANQGDPDYISSRDPDPIKLAEVKDIIRDNLSGPMFSAPHLREAHQQDINLTARLILAALDAIPQPAKVPDVVRVRPLEWVPGDDLDELISGPYEIWHEHGGWQLFFWSIAVGEPHPTIEAAKAAAWKHHEPRVLVLVYTLPATQTPAT